MHRFEEIRDNPELLQKLRGAMEVRRLIREWFRLQGFFEVETPILVRAPGQEPHLSPFETVVRDERGMEMPARLITSPEYALKKLLVAGFPQVFELARCFRNNEPTGGLHNPDFTMLEWYRAGTDYRGIMEDVEQLVFYIHQNLLRTTYYILRTVDFTPPWEHLSAREAFQRYAGVDLERELDRPDFEDWYFKTFLTKIERMLGHTKPTILYDYPASMAALARLKPTDPRYAERFEVYVRGLELANAFSELTDVKEQRRRFLGEQEARRKAGKPVHPIDEEFLAALEAGLPSCGGIALGVDRLAMVLLDARSIREVLSFPWN